MSCNSTSAEEFQMKNINFNYFYLFEKISGEVGKLVNLLLEMDLFHELYWILSALLLGCSIVIY